MTKQHKSTDAFQAASFPDWVIDKVIELHEKGMIPAEIDFVLKSQHKNNRLPARGTIRGWINKYKTSGSKSGIFKQKNLRYTKAIKDAAVDMYKRGASTTKVAREISRQFNLSPQLRKEAIIKWTKARGVYTLPGHPVSVKKLCAEMLKNKKASRAEIVAHIRETIPDYKKKYHVDYPDLRTLSKWKVDFFPETRKRPLYQHPDKIRERAVELVLKCDDVNKALEILHKELKSKGVSKLPNRMNLFSWTRGKRKGPRSVRYPQRVKDEIERLHIEEGLLAMAIAERLHDKYKSTNTLYPKTNIPVQRIIDKIRKRRMNE